MTYFFIFCFGLLDVKSKYYTVILYSFDEKRFDFDVKKNIICVYKIKRSRENCKIKHLILFVYLQLYLIILLLWKTEKIIYETKEGENYNYFSSFVDTF